MRSLRDLPIRHKLTLYLLVIVSVVLLLCSTAFVVNDVRLIRSSMRERVLALAEVMGANSAAALSFNDPATAGDVLASLRQDPTIVFACTYDASGKVMATYKAPGATGEAPPPGQEGAVFTPDGYLDVFQPVIQDRERLGTVYLRASMAGLDAQLRRYAVIVAAVLAVSLAISLLLSLQLQTLLTTPILRLARAVETVSAKGDYSIRVGKAGNDELGVLCDGFNSMLASIDAMRTALRDRLTQLGAEIDRRKEAEAGLQRAHDELERRVADRTAELTAVNDNLRVEIAERQRAEERLRQTAAELARSNAELEQFAYVASHDLQEPLRKVQAFGDMLATACGTALTEEGQDYLRRMQNAARRMQLLINDLLTFSRVTSQAKPYVQVDLARTAREVLSDLEARLQDTQGRVEVGELPQLDADPLQMHQLLQNLIGNALKFHRPNEPPLVQVQGRVLKGGGGGLPAGMTPEDVCEITVRDNGIGFDEKYRERIFAPFQRLHGRGEYEGTGMGLAICRKIVERHGGTITVRSAPGQGATFVALLPRRQRKGERPFE